MRTADEQRGGARRECQRRAGAPRRSHHGAMVEQMGESEGERGQTDGRGRLFSFTVSLLMGILLCRCNTPPLLHFFFQLFHNNNNNNNINNNDHDNAKKIYINPCYVSQLQVHKKGGGEALPSSSSES